MHAQVLFRSLVETTVVVDLIMLDDSGDDLRHIGTAGEPVTVALCLDGGDLGDVNRADRQFEEWAMAMATVELSLVDDRAGAFLRITGPSDELTLELEAGFRWRNEPRPGAS